MGRLRTVARVVVVCLVIDTWGSIPTALLSSAISQKRVAIRHWQTTPHCKAFPRRRTRALTILVAPKLRADSMSRFAMPRMFSCSARARSSWVG